MAGDLEPASVPSEPFDHEPIFEEPDAEADRILAFEALVRASMGPPEPSDAEIRRQLDRRDAWNECPYTPERLAHINELTAQFYEQRLPGSWAQPYLAERLHARTSPATTRSAPATPPTAGPASSSTSTSTASPTKKCSPPASPPEPAPGRLIDRFRDRVVFPICDDNRVLGFVGRRNPQYSDDTTHGPKYLNTPDTPLFHKGDQLYVIPSEPFAVPVLVEGPLDAIAVTLASGSTHFGAAPLGTSLTPNQAAQLSTLSATPIVATDGDAAGRQAAERDYWQLAAVGLNPHHANLPEGTDPASLVMDRQAGGLADALREARPLASQLLDDHLHKCGDPDEVLYCTRVIAAMPPEEWANAATALAQRTELPVGLVRVTLASTVQAWNDDPAKAAEQAMPRHSQQPIADAAAGQRRPTVPPEPRARSSRRESPDIAR